MGRFTHEGRPGCPGPPWLRASIGLLLLCAALAPPGAAQVPGQACSDYPGFRTGVLRFAPPGWVGARVGVEYLPDVTNDVAGVRGDLLRLPSLGLRLGLSSNAEFQVSCPVYNRLRVISQQQPPPLGRTLGRFSSDAGDLVVATLIQLRAEGPRWPACGIRFAAKLPNSNEKYGIGDNSTDVFASGLVSKSVSSRLTLYGDLGLGILTEPTTEFTQNDVLIYGLMADYWAGHKVHLLSEVAGRQATHRGGPGTDSSGEVRAGIGAGVGPLTWNALLVHGITPRDTAGLGFAAYVSSRIAVLRHDRTAGESGP